MMRIIEISWFRRSLKHCCLSDRRRVRCWSSGLDVKLVRTLRTGIGIDGGGGNVGDGRAVPEEPAGGLLLGLLDAAAHVQQAREIRVAARFEAREFGIEVWIGHEMSPCSNRGDWRRSA